MENLSEYEDKIEVIGCAIVQNQADLVVENIQSTYKYVDKYVIVDGGSTDGLQNMLLSIDYDSKINIYDHPWCDNFPFQRSQYLIHAGEIRDSEKETWIMRFDTDEFISEGVLKRIKKLILLVSNKIGPTGVGFNMIGVTSKDTELDRDGNVVKYNVSDFKKGLIYKWYPDLRYIGGGYGYVHEGYNKQMIKFDLPVKHSSGEELVYYHKKSQGQIWARSQRNYYIGGGGDNLGPINKSWIELREICDRVIDPKPETYHDYLSYLEKGNIHKDFKDHYIKYMLEGAEERDFNKYPKSETEIYFETHDHMNHSGNRGLAYPGSSEVREAFRYYFEYLHPNELLELDESVVMDSPIENEVKEWYNKNKEKLND